MNIVKGDDRQFRKDIGVLYLNKALSDLTIVIDGIELPAHRAILWVRCPYLKAVLKRGDIKSTSQRMELFKTPINSFKVILKFIYSEEIEFTDVDNAFEVLHLAHTYTVKGLNGTIVNYIKANFNVDNICSILNNAVLLSHSILIGYSCLFIEENDVDVVAHATFTRLSKDALEKVLKLFLDHVTKIDILKAFVRWMQANPDKSEHFSELLKLIPLNSIIFGELFSIVPAELISAYVLADVASEQQIEFESRSIVNDDFTPRYE